MTAPDRTAEEMAAAAKTLRETAAKPLEGIEPLVEGDPDEWTGYYSQEHISLPVGSLSVGDAPWITLMTPKLAEPLADLFDAVKRFVDEHPDLGREHVDGKPCDDYACGIVNRARRLARVINGGA